MSRIGIKPVQIPENVNVAVEGKTVKVSGPKGELEFILPEPITARAQAAKVLVERRRNSKIAKALHGTANRQIKNMVTGVNEGWSKNLELVGTGYRARLEGQSLVLNVGFSHPIKVSTPEGISFSVEENTKVKIEGIDKTLVGQAAANIRAIRPPEPYKGKGIRYEDEVVRRKAGKAAKAGPAAA